MYCTRSYDNRNTIVIIIILYPSIYATIYDQTHNNYYNIITASVSLYNSASREMGNVIIIAHLALLQLLDHTVGISLVPTPICGRGFSPSGSPNRPGNEAKLECYDYIILTCF